MSNSPNNPLVSVIIPAHNEDRWIEGCVESFLNQSHKNIELIIVNDGSKDESLSVAQELERRIPSLKVINFPEVRGEGAARHAGIERSTGEFIVQTDADALYPPDFIEKGLSYFQKDPDLSALSIGYLEVHPAQKGVIADYFRLKREASYLIRQKGEKAEVSGFFMYRRTVLDYIGNYDTSVPGGTDLDFGMRLKKAGLKYAWAEDMHFQHADPSELRQFLKRTFNQSAYWHEAYKRWNMLPSKKKIALISAISLFISLSPLYLLLAFLHSVWWILPLGFFLSLESVVPLILDKESRELARLAIQKKWYKTFLLLPPILFLRLRASNYGKIYAMLFPKQTKNAVTFDV